MKKVETATPSGTMRPEYDFSGGTRGKYAARYAEGSNIVALDPDVARLYPDSKSVNRALRAIAQAAPVPKNNDKTKP